MKKINMRELIAAYRGVEKTRIKASKTSLPEKLRCKAPRVEEAYRCIEETEINPKQKSSLPAKIRGE